MLEKFINSLDQAGFKLDDQEIADILWLAIQIDAAAISQNIEEIESAPYATVSQKPNLSPPELDLITDSNGKNTKNTQQRPTNDVANIYLQSSLKGNKLSQQSINYTALKVPTATALPQALSISRALRPLMRKVPSLKEKIIDEQATVKRIAEENIWLPVLKSLPTKWLELALVVEENNFVGIWKQTIIELRQLLQCHGAFQDVRTWKLKADTQEIFTRVGRDISQQKPRSYKELNDPTGRRLIVIVSDCISPTWYDGTINQLFREWSKYSPVTILQLLPEKLWTRTALGLSTPVMFSSLAPGVPNRKLLVEDLDPWEEEEIDFASALKMPVITLEEKPLADWSRVIAGIGSTATAGFVLESENDLEKEQSGNTPQLSALERVNLFHATASRTARRLAGLMAAIPVSLPVIRLIQKTMLPDSQQVHVAEVFMSGLLTKFSTEFSEINPDYIEYEFVPEIRELLLQSISKSDAVNVIQCISQYLAARIGLSIGEFRAVLLNPQPEIAETTITNLLPFAQITAKVLRRLGGEYTMIAQQLERHCVEHSTPESVLEPSSSPQKSKNWAIAIGINYYDHLQSLQYAKQDAKAMANWLEQAAGFDKVILFTDESPEFSNLQTYPSTGNLKRFLQRQFESPLLDSGDNLYFFFSGHGIDDQDRDYLLASNSNPRDISRTGISIDYIIRKLRKSGANNIFMFIDANRTVGYGKDEGTGLGKHLQAQLLVDSSPAIPDQFELNVKRKQGVIQFFACRPNEHSYEIDELQQGIFTYALLQGLSSGICHTVKDLEKFLRKTTADLTNLYGQSRQTPFVFTEPLNKINTNLFSQPNIVDEYQRLQELLAAGKWKQADEETVRIIRKATNRGNKSWRYWLDLEDLSNLSVEVLKTIDQLWIDYSAGCFGFGVQHKIYQSLNSSSSFDVDTWELFGDRLGWRSNGQWLNYENFTFSLVAPQGHFPTWLDLLGLDYWGYRRSRISEFIHLLEKCQFEPENRDRAKRTGRANRQLSKLLLQVCEFDVITVNRRGEIISSETKSAQYFSENLESNICLDMVYIPGSTFWMGASEDERGSDQSERPQHLVTVNSFFMGKYPITQEQWRNVSYLEPIKHEFKTRASKESYYPIERVSWFDAIEFCARLSRYTGKKYRLPSEAEWEYACRAKTNTLFHYGETITNELGNYFIDDNRPQKYRHKLTTVGDFPPNAFGLYDMHGNVWEWCEDHWHGNYNQAPSNGSAWLENNVNHNHYRLRRGGSWRSNALNCRSAYRNGSSPHIRNLNVGLRVVCDLLM